jgi:sirohydrochlorin cobaltochelatase
MTMTDDDRRTLEELERRLRTLLPEEYWDSYEEVQPVSMGSAGLVYGRDGQVAWNEMWASFCDLAMAGGPPHKGSLLEPASLREIDAGPSGYAQVVTEICRGIGLVTELDAAPSPDAGWVRVECLSRGMAAWLVRAITMENVAVRAEGVMLDLPAGPGYRVEKEIKNVITAVAKTTHYWLGHMSVVQRRSIAALLDAMAAESPLFAPDYGSHQFGVDPREAVAAHAAEAIHGETGLVRSPHRYTSWLGLECGTVRAAVWMMRMLVTVNVLSRREHTSLFVPVNPAVDPEATIVVSSLSLLHRLAVARGIC